MKMFCLKASASNSDGEDRKLTRKEKDGGCKIEYTTEKPATPLLDTINYPAHMKNLSTQDLEQLAAELRMDIVHSVSQTGGHLSFSLGVVELSVALHHVFSTPDDKIIWDVGHQDIQVRKKPGLSTDDIFDTVCAFCDNGGSLLCCEGRCLRSFHATVKDGEGFTCESLGFSQDEVDAIRKIDFYCKNCQYKQHQCYACGRLGSSDKSLGAEVFPCTSARCGQFYHPHCIAKLRYHETGVSAEELEKRIMLGESFTCPIHKCWFCKQGENKKDPELQFAVCRRCPTSYHRKCLPRDIRFAKGKEGDEEDMDTRAWEGLLPDRVLIYCTKHRIVKAFGTPRRDHVKFPDVDDNKISAEKKTLCQEKKRRLTSESLVVSENCVSMRKRLSSEGLHKEKNAPTTHRQKMTLAAKAGKHSKLKSAIVKPSSRKSSSPSSSLDSARVLRLDALMKHASASITLDDVIRKHRVPSNHVSSKRTAAEMNITLGKVEDSVKAV